MKTRMSMSQITTTLLVLILPLLFCACKPPNTPTTVEITTVETDITLDFSQPEKPFELEKAIFLGDSNIAHLVSYNLIPRNRVWTGSESYLTLEPDVFRKYIVYPETGEQMTVSSAVRLKKPDFLIITLGTDGALSLNREGLRLSYTQLVESVKRASPETRIFIQSIFPVCTGSKDLRFKNVETANLKFRQANEWLAELSDELNIGYLDTQSVLSDSDGCLKSEYNTDHLDGYHLNRDGLSRMLEYIGENADE